MHSPAKLKNIILPIVFIAVFIGLVIIKCHIGQIFEYNVDEGVNLTKSLLYLNGFSLYKQIYNDQPPLLTIILVGLIKLFGLSAYHARILILIFSGILLWAFYQTIRILWGHLCAFIASVFLILSTAYIPLSISVMIGIPSLSLAMLSIYCVTLYGNGKTRLRHLLILSGIFMALSLQTKLFTVFLIPIIILEIVQAKRAGIENKKQQKQSLLHIILWLCTLLGGWFIITVIFFNFNFHLLNQCLFQPHLKQLIVPQNNFSLIWKMLLTDYDIFLLALIGTTLLILRKKWQFFFPVLWLALILIILFMQNPVWHHYYMLVSIPVSWLAAISIREFFRKDIRHKWFSLKNPFSWMMVGLAAIVILRLPVKYYRAFDYIGSEISQDEKSILNLLSKFKPHTRWIVTDRPIFAFYSNILVPPELVLTVPKRNFISQPAQDYFIEKLQEYSPEIILLNRYDYYGPEAISYIERNYTKIYQCDLSRRIWVPNWIYGINKYLWFYNILIAGSDISYSFFGIEMALYIRPDNIKLYGNDTLKVTRKLPFTH